jgi:hypothetical protein
MSGKKQNPAKRQNMSIHQQPEQPLETTHPSKTSPADSSNNRLVDARTLLKMLWDADSCPSLHWLRQQQVERTMPFVKIGARVWFDPMEVRRCLTERWSIGGRSGQRH